MQTVNFRCGHCNNLMAVGVDFLGQQVRCPTCQNVVVAPAASPDPAPAPAEFRTDNLFPSITEHEDIFSPASQPSDSLFDEPAQQRLELPASPFVTPEGPPGEPTPSPDLFFESNASHSPAEFQHQPDATYAPDGGAFGPSESPPRSEDVSAPWMSSPLDNGQPAAPEPFAEPTKPREPREAKINWFIPLVFIPLVLYAVLATAATAFLYLRMASTPSMFDQLPDTQGDTPGTRPSKAKGQIFNIDPKLATSPLPEHLKVALGSAKPLVVGDIEVTPTKLERGHFAIFTEGAKAEPLASPHLSLKLHLRIKNRAPDYAFTPLDNFFDRKWLPGGATPLTLVEAGPKTFYGGPAHWYPLNRDRNKGQRRDWLDGRMDVDHEGLPPGETTETFVCTDGWDPAVQLHLFGLDEQGEAKQKPYSGDLLWRVQLRRGLIDHKGRRLPATAVIGVRFNSADLPTKEAAEGL